jgi:peptide deformylase
MKKEDIITLPHQSLRQSSAKMGFSDEEKASIQQLISDMESATLDWEDSRPHEIGAALAAVQINDLRRVVIVRSDFDDKENRQFTALINPKVIRAEGKRIADHEGCLSVKDIYGLVPRYEKVKVKAYDLDGNEVRIKAEGFLARVLQHEIDHTNGILFVDHIKEKKDAFFTLDGKGALKAIDYDTAIKDSSILW